MFSGLSTLDRASARPDLSPSLERSLQHLAWKYGCPQAPAEDLLQVARVAALLAADTADSARFAPERWAFQRAWSAVRHFVRAERQQPVSYDGFEQWQAAHLLAGRDFAPALIAALEEEEVMDDTALTPQELVVLREACTGLSARQVAEKLFLSKRTVDFHLRNVYQKWQVPSLVGAYNEAMRRGLIDAPVTRDS